MACELARMFSVCVAAAILSCLLLEGTCARYSSVADMLHELMTLEELAYYFGISSPSSVPDYQVVFLRDPLLVASDEAGSSNEDKEEVRYDFEAFGRPVQLRLQKNRHLVSPNLKVVRRIGEVEERLESPIPDCHYLHRDGSSFAAISLCQERSMHGFLVMQNDTYEIRPLTPRLMSLLEPKFNASPHLLTKAPFIPEILLDDEVFISEPLDFFEEELEDNGVFGRQTRATSGITVELAMFFDEAGYRIFSPYFRGDDNQLRDMLLAYLNGVQALYHHPSLGQSVDLVLVRLEIFKRQPSDLPHYEGERSKLLDSFCDYHSKHNPKDDSNPDHWDMGLYVSGLDFFAYENGRKSGVTMGLATVGGVCFDKYACVIAELGTTNNFGKPYPSAGFTSVYILAHEIGHNLGMHHDSTRNSCPKEGYIMSPSRGTNGETQWSSCSAEVISKMSWAKCLTDKQKSPGKDKDHSKFGGTPGQSWGAKKQCEILLRDKDATLMDPGNLNSICQNLKCKTPHRSGFYYAGPALEGTSCGSGKWCQGGDCVIMKKKKPDKVVKGGWSEWKPDKCFSGCIDKSRGYQPRRRTCDNPKPVNTEEGCEGPSYDVILCKDNTLCKKGKRRAVEDFAGEKCKGFSKVIKDLDQKGVGLQAPYEQGRLWMSCAIFCRRKDTGSFYTPRIELNDLGMDPYFPDGTWCHNDGKYDYYCLKHHCLPENFKFGRGILMSEDLSLLQNALPKGLPIPEDLMKYLSIGSDGRPLSTDLNPKISEKTGSNEDWSDKDYLELPKMSAISGNY